MDRESIAIPTIPKMYAPVDRKYPISKKENLLLALSQQKPAFMPNLNDAAQMIPPFAYGDMPPYIDRDGTDWFGLEYLYNEAGGSSTASNPLYTGGIESWIDKVEWPDLDSWDWKKGYEEFHKDPELATACWFTNGIFERLHLFEGFNDGLYDLLRSADICKDFFDRMADHKIEVFRRIHEVYGLDYIIYNDDWGTQNGPFFSDKVINNLLLEPTARVVQAVHDAGVKLIFHNCGLVNKLIHFLVEDIHADGLEIQSMNDIKGIITTYGDRVTSEYQMDLHVLYDPDATEDTARNYARELVDTYGAHANPGAGVMMLGSALKAEVWYAFEEELYNYSRELYSKL